MTPHLFLIDDKDISDQTLRNTSKAPASNNRTDALLLSLSTDKMSTAKRQADSKSRERLHYALKSEKRHAEAKPFNLVVPTQLTGALMPHHHTKQKTNSLIHNRNWQLLQDQRNSLLAKEAIENTTGG